MNSFLKENLQNISTNPIYNHITVIHFLHIFDRKIGFDFWVDAKNTKNLELPYWMQDFFFLYKFFLYQVILHLKGFIEKQPTETLSVAGYTRRRIEEPSKKKIHVCRPHTLMTSALNTREEDFTFFEIYCIRLY